MAVTTVTAMTKIKVGFYETNFNRKIKTADI